jgi:ribosomal protein L37AE/L43A
LISLVDIAPDYFKYPETSAYWEDAFKSFQSGDMRLGDFYAKQTAMLKRFFSDLSKGSFKLKEPSTDTYRHCPDPCGGFAFFQELKKKDFDLWVCGKCDSAYIDKKGQLGSKLGAGGSGKTGGVPPKWDPPKGTPKTKCPECSTGKAYHKKMPGKGWSLWECQDCNVSFFDNKGAPGNKMEKKGRKDK